LTVFSHRTDSTFECFLTRVSSELPSIDTISFALRTDPWSLFKWLSLGVASFLVVGRKLAKFLKRVNGVLPSREDAEELAGIWSRFEVVSGWAREVLLLVESDPTVDAFSVGVLQVRLPSLLCCLSWVSSTLTALLDPLRCLSE
jgi:hypothetical protein